MIFRFEAEIWYWRGPAPFHFLSLPPEEAELIREASGLLTYGWGMIPVSVRIGQTEFRTAMWPKDGGYSLPVKVAVRKAEGLEVGDMVAVELTVGAVSSD